MDSDGSFSDFQETKRSVSMRKAIIGIKTVKKKDVTSKKSCVPINLSKSKSSQDLPEENKSTVIKACSQIVDSQRSFVDTNSEVEHVYSCTGDFSNSGVDSSYVSGEEIFAHKSISLNSCNESVENTSVKFCDQVPSQLSTCESISQSVNVIWQCPMCKEFIPSSCRDSHRTYCLKKYEHKKSSINGVSNPKTFICDICKLDITSLNPFGRSEHVNKCLDSQVENGKPKELCSKSSSEQQQAFVITECPLCNKNCSSIEAKLAHVKKCGQALGIDVQNVITALQLQQKHAVERISLGLPILPTKCTLPRAKPKPAKKPIREPKTKMDADLQLAKALSLSVNEENDVSLYEETEANNFVTALHPVRLQPPKKDQKPGGGKKKKNVSKPIPLLLLRTEEERVKLLQEKVSSIIAPQSPTETVPSSSVTTKTTAGIEDDDCCTSTQRKECHLWALSSKAEEKMCYYVIDLLEFVTPDDVETGSKLKSLSQIPGHRICTQKAYDFTFSCTPATQPVSDPSQSIPSTQEMLDIIVGVENTQNKTFLGTQLSSSICKTDVNSFSFNKEQVSDGFLRSENAHETLVSYHPVISCLETLVNNTWMSDVDIIVSNGNSVPAHKLLLMLRCPGLREELTDTSNSKKFELDWSDVSDDVCKNFLNFVYTGSKSWPPSETQAILTLAERCKVKELEMFLKSDLNSSLNEDLLSQQINVTSNRSVLLENDRMTTSSQSNISVLRVIDLEQDTEPMIVSEKPSSSGYFTGQVSKKRSRSSSLSPSSCKTNKSSCNSEQRPHSKDELLEKNDVPYNEDNPLNLPQESTSKYFNSIDDGFKGNCINVPSEMSKVESFPQSSPHGERVLSSPDLFICNSDENEIAENIPNTFSTAHSCNNHSLTVSPIEVSSGHDSHSSHSNDITVLMPENHLPSENVNLPESKKSPMCCTTESVTLNFVSMSKQSPLLSQNSNSKTGLDCEMVDLNKNEVPEKDAFFNTASTCLDFLNDAVHSPVNCVSIHKELNSKDHISEKVILNSPNVNIDSDIDCVVPYDEYDDMQVSYERITHSPGVQCFSANISSPNTSPFKTSPVLHDTPLSSKKLYVKSQCNFHSNQDISSRTTSYRLLGPACNSNICEDVSLANSRLKRIRSESDILWVTPKKHNRTRSENAPNTQTHFSSSQFSAFLDPITTFKPKNHVADVEKNKFDNEIKSSVELDVQESTENNQIEKANLLSCMSPVILSSDDDDDDDIEIAKHDVGAISEMINSDVPISCLEENKGPVNSLPSFSEISHSKTDNHFLPSSQVLKNLAFDDDEELLPLHLRIRNLASENKNNQRSSTVTYNPPSCKNQHIDIDDDDNEVPCLSQVLPTTQNVDVSNTVITQSHAVIEKNKAIEKTVGTPDTAKQLNNLKNAVCQITDSPITPLPDYKSMVTPEIKGALKKYGIRPLPRKKAVALLSHIYEKTHPLVSSDGEIIEEPETSLSQNKAATQIHKKVPSKKRKDLSQFTQESGKNSVNDQIQPKKRIKAVKKTLDPPPTQSKDSDSVVQSETYVDEPSSQNPNDVSSSQNSSKSDLSDMPEESFLESEVFSASQKCESDILSKEKVRNYILSNTELYSKILMYEPLNLSNFHQELKEKGVKINTTDLMNFLDEECITFTLPRSEKSKKKQQQRCQRFRKRMIQKCSQSCS